MHNSINIFCCYIGVGTAYTNNYMVPKNASHAKTLSPFKATFHSLLTACKILCSLSNGVSFCSPSPGDSADI